MLLIIFIGNGLLAIGYWLLVIGYWQWETDGYEQNSTTSICPAITLRNIVNGCTVA